MPGFVFLVGALILALWALVVFVYLHYEHGQSFNELTAVCVVVPLALAGSRAWRARRGQIEIHDRPAR